MLLKFINSRYKGEDKETNFAVTHEHCNKSKQDKEDNPQYKYEPWW